VLGGIGNLAGAVVGGILLGLIESIGAGYLEPLTFGILNSSYQDIFAFIALILALVLRPSGLLGERVADRATAENHRVAGLMLGVDANGIVMYASNFGIAHYAVGISCGKVW
jgi:branched-subunit amino acid ABC-type transport system permease component